MFGINKNLELVSSSCPSSKFYFICNTYFQEMSAKEKRRFEEMAEKDKIRYENDMKGYTPGPGEKVGKKKRTKDPNAPKRSL